MIGREDPGCGRPQGRTVVREQVPGRNGLARPPPAERLGHEVTKLRGRGLRAEDGREGSASSQEIQLGDAGRRGARHVRGHGDDIVPVQFARGRAGR